MGSKAENWARKLEKYIGHEVNVIADGKYVQKDFRGILLTVKTDSSPFYAIVKDKNNKSFSMSILNVEIPEEE